MGARGLRPAGRVPAELRPCGSAPVRLGLALILALLVACPLAGGPARAQLPADRPELPSCEQLAAWQAAAPDPDADPEAFADAIVPFLAAWELIRELDPADPRLDGETRDRAACGAHMIEQIGIVGFLPEGVTRLEALRSVAAFAAADHPFERRHRARLQADLVEATFDAQLRAEGLELVARAREDFADVPEILAEILLLAANANESLGEFAAAQDLAREAESLLAQLPEGRVAEPYVPIFSLLVRAKILIHSGVPDQAAALLEEARSIAADRGLDDCAAMLLTTGTEWAQASGNWDWIITNVQAALDAGPIPGGEPDDRVRRELDVVQARAFLAMQSGKGLEGARRELLSALDRLGPDDPYAWPAALTLCDLELSLGETDSADARARALAAGIGRSGRIASLPVRSNLAGVRGRIALALAAVPDRHPGPEEWSARRADADSAFAELLQAWKSVEHREGGIGFLHFDERRALLVTVMRLQPTLERAFDCLFAVEALGSLARRLGTATATLPRVEESLIPHGGGILIYVPSAWGSIAITLDARGPELWPLPGSDGWARHEEALAREMQPQSAREEGARERCARIALALRDQLLPAELDARICTWEEIVFVRAENVGRIPFEVLPLAGRGGSALGLELATSYLPSLSVGLGLLERRARRADPTAPGATGAVSILVGPLEGESGSGRDAPPPIPWRSDDASRLGAAWSTGRVEFVLEPSRALRLLRAAGDSGVALLEVFAHGVRDAGREQTQGVFLGGSATLYAEDLLGSSAAPLCMLLVCGAAAGTTRRGDDLGSHLEAAFLSNGSDVVASSRRDLSFEASVSLMEAVHRELARGATPARALLAARRELAASEEWGHPAFHSNLHLSGIAFAPTPEALSPSQAADATPSSDQRTRSQRWLLYALAAGGVLVAAVGISARRRAG